MKLTTLFSRTSTGAEQQWTIEVEGGRYRTIHGQVGGKLVLSEWTDCKPKNKGKSNATDAETQAMREALALYKKKQESGYFESLSDIDNTCWEEPMRAKEYEEIKEKDKKGLLKFPLGCQPKLDGHRCVINKDGAWTRRGKRYVCIPHIVTGLSPLFEEFPSLVLDGELYADKYADDFNELSSIVRQSKPTAEDIEKSKECIQYWVYDIASGNDTFFTRTLKLQFLLGNLNVPWLVLVPTTIAYNQEELDQKFGEYLEAGYEGQMVRLDKPYEWKRTKSLLKRKLFQDAEFVAVDVVEGEGNRKGTLACIWFVNEDGHRFKGDMKGSREYCRDLWEKRDRIPGTRWTVEFFNRTPDKNIPRFPKVKAQRFD